MVSIEEYLRTSFEGLDREYVDGEIVARSPTEEPHSAAQWRLSGLFWDLSKTLPFYGYSGQRLRVGPTRVRVADVGIYANREPCESVPSQPPLVVIEIVSRNDRHLEVMQKLKEYSDWGVPHIWLVDPERRSLYVYANGALSE